MSDTRDAMGQAGWSARALALRAEWANRAARRRLVTALAAEARREAAAPGVELPDGMAERVWGRLEAELAPWAPQSGKAPARRKLPAYWLAAPALAAAAAAVLFLLSGTLGSWRQDSGATQSGATWDTGVKGPTSATQTFGHVTGLRFAVVGEDGLVVPGDGATAVHVGRPIVFYVEAEGVDTQLGLPVDLSVASPDGEHGAVVRDYRLKGGREPISGEHGYVAFSPSRPGTYTFTVKGGSHAAKVAVRVVD